MQFSCCDVLFFLLLSIYGDRYFYCLKVFHPSVSGVLLQESEGERESISHLSSVVDVHNTVDLKDGLDVLHSSSDLLFIPYHFYAFWDHSVGINKNWCHHQARVLWHGRNICLSFHLLLFSICGSQKHKIYSTASSVSVCLSLSPLFITKSGLLDEIWRSLYCSKSQRIVYVSFSRTDSGLC